MTDVIRMRCRVLEVREKTRQQYLGGIGDKAEFARVGEGWMLVLQGDPAPFAVFAGAGKPTNEVDEFVVIEIKREKRS